MTDIITTAAELAALPITSVIRCDDNEGIGLNVCERHKEGWQYVGSSIHFSSAQVASDGVAFTVLYRPDQPTEPARVLPSREEIAAALSAHRLRSASMTSDGGSKHACSCGSEWRAEKGEYGSWDRHHADAILALFAAQPTVEQVKAQVLRGFAEDFDQWATRWRSGGWGSNPADQQTIAFAVDALKEIHAAADRLAGGGSDE